MAGTFDVQHCDAHTDHTSYILVECTFAINSTAPGFVLLDNGNHEELLWQYLNDSCSHKGSVNVTYLPAGEYNVTVYDEIEDYMSNNPAYVSPCLKINDHNIQPSVFSTVQVYSSGVVGVICL